MKITRAVILCGYCNKKPLKSSRNRYCSRECMWEDRRSRYKSNRALAHLNINFRGKVCERCGAKMKLALHHKDLNPRNNEPSNRQTLCSSCHAKVHHALGTLKRKTIALHCSVCGATGQLQRTLCKKHYHRLIKYGNARFTKVRVGHSNNWKLVVE